MRTAALIDLQTLGLKYGASPKDIKRAYYKLAMKYHPDKNKDPAAVPLYRAIANAYEVLSNPTTKANYDDMLEHPENYYVHRMRYYRHRMTQIRVSTVLLGFLVLLTIFQFFYWRRTHYQTVLSLRDHPEVQTRLEALRKSENRTKLYTDIESTDPKVILEAKRKQDQQDYEDIKRVATINGWQGRLPGWRDLLPVHVFWLPYRITSSILWGLKWAIWHGWLGFEYSSAVDINYATSLALNVPWHIWTTIPYKSRKSLLEKKLWHPENLEAFKIATGMQKAPKHESRVAYGGKAAVKAAAQAAIARRQAAAQQKHA